MDRSSAPPTPLRAPCGRGSELGSSTQFSSAGSPVNSSPGLASTAPPAWGGPFPSPSLRAPSLRWVRRCPLLPPSLCFPHHSTAKPAMFCSRTVAPSWTLTVVKAEHKSSAFPPFGVQVGWESDMYPKLPFPRTSSPASPILCSSQMLPTLPPPAFPPGPASGFQGHKCAFTKCRAHCICYFTYSPSPLKAGTTHACSDQQRLIACQLRPAACCDAPFVGKVTEKWVGSVVALGYGHPPSAPTGELQAEPVPQRAADLQAGFAVLVTVRTQHIQLTHLTIDLRGPHSACARFSGAQPGTQCIVRRAVLGSLGHIGPKRTSHESLGSCQICPTPSMKGSPPS